MWHSQFMSHRRRKRRPLVNLSGSLIETTGPQIQVEKGVLCSRRRFELMSAIFEHKFGQAPILRYRSKWLTSYTGPTC